MTRTLVSVAAVMIAVLGSRADGPQDNIPDKVRPIPPAGIAIPEAERRSLEAGLQELARETEALRRELKGNLPLADLLPDVLIYQKAVHFALNYNEFFNLKETAVARTLLQQGLERARQLRQGKAPWTTATGLVVRGYVSRLDDSIQPYGLVVPASFEPGSPHRHRLDVWFHGRGETLSELNFINQRQNSPGEFTPPHALVLHPYGRYCNANKFAGEVDLFECLEAVARHYPVDENRIVVRGFSMGGAACWHIAAHHAWRWAAAAPGAGFAETAEFLRVFQNEAVQPKPYEQKLWRLYDATDYALNFFHCPVVAYSGEADRQKQAAEVMARALAAEGIDLVHIIGPKTGHSYHPESKTLINRRIDQIAAIGRDLAPKLVKFTTWTLRYNRMHWVALQGLERHWERARVEAELSRGHQEVRMKTENVSAVTLVMPPGLCTLDPTRRPLVQIDGQELEGAKPLSDRSWTAHFRKVRGQWRAVETQDDGLLRKRPGLQGPIDDAFMDRFLFVTPTQPSPNPRIAAWVAAEQKRAIEEWRRQFRGGVNVKTDQQVTPEDIAACNLVLWGDPDSNRLIRDLAGKLPIRWDARTLGLSNQRYDARTHVPVLIYPNPLNPRRYVVLNSGFTYREYDYLNNARQVPRLPDYAVIDTTTPPSSVAPGGIAAAGFFDENWRLPYQGWGF